YKERSSVLQNFATTLYNSQGSAAGQASPTIGNFGYAPMVRDLGMNLAQGAPKYTGSPLDVMVVGNGLFRVRAGNQILLTRNGNFHQAANGQLQTVDGYPVLDAAGQPITVPQGTVTIDRGGNLKVNGKQTARLGLANVAAGQPLTDVGNGYLSGASTVVAAGAANTAVVQGYLETSNVDMTTQTTAMLSAQRAYQADAQMLQMQDDTMSLAVSDLGKVNG
ncbi:MAG: flagellar hook-basal body protein, partial [Chloroflexota bacterium]